MDPLWLEVKIDGDITTHLITGAIVLAVIAALLIFLRVYKWKKMAVRRARKKAEQANPKKEG
jgi:uncharacterized protein (DUF2062 family)